MANRFETLIAESVQSISSRWKKRPRFGIVLGTGAGLVADQIQAEAIMPYETISHFPVSTAIGHKGNLVCGTLAGHDVIAMQGRFHLYEGYALEAATLPIHVMHAMGVEILFVSNAAGGLNPKMASGDLMLIESHVDFMNRTSSLAFRESACGRPTFRNDRAYCPALLKRSHSIARRHGFALHEGVYAAMLGPNYETRVNVAARCGMRVLAMSIITNVAKPDVLESTSGEEVIDAAKVAAPNLKRIVTGVINESVA
jgi:purine-nucleoside phosphorylase